MVTFYCPACGKSQPAVIETLNISIGDASTPNTRPWGDIFCSVCNLVITTIEADVAGRYEFIKSTDLRLLRTEATEGRLDGFVSKPWGGANWKAWIPTAAEDDWYAFVSNAANVERLERENQRLQAEIETLRGELEAAVSEPIYYRTGAGGANELRAKLTAPNHPMTQSPSDQMNNTLCDMVLGEDAPDRSDAALLAAVRQLLTRSEQAARQDEALTALSQRCVAMENNLAAIRNALAFIVPQENESTLEIVQRVARRVSALNRFGADMYGLLNALKQGAILNAWQHEAITIAKRCWNSAYIPD